MWLKFSERARRAIFLAQENAKRLGHCCISTEHLLLGVLEEGDNVACDVLQRIGIDREKLRSEIGYEDIAVSSREPVEDMDLAPRALRAIELSCEEANQLGDSYVGTRHLLLGLVREGEGVAARVLAANGADLERMRQEVANVDIYEREGVPDSAVLGFKLPEDDGQTSISETASGSRGIHVDNSLRGRDLLSINDLSVEEIYKVFDVARDLKALSLVEQVRNPVLPGKTLAMIFEKPSLRTRVTFEVGIVQLGGYAVYLQPSDIRLGVRETVADAARNLERWVQGIMARTFSHDTVTDLAKYADVPVINGLSDLEHPCQALADFLTILEHKGKLKGLKLAYVGDGNNVCHSLMLLAGKVGMNMAVGCPNGYDPSPEMTKLASGLASDSGSSLEITHDPIVAVRDADVVYTDVWASMGQEAEHDERLPIFKPYQVNAALIANAKDDVMVLHCLPAKRGEEITDDVIDGPNSAVLDEAENRLHAEKAVMALLM
jgi:ornithine carbamoyltransferase